MASVDGKGPSPVESPDEWMAWAGVRLELPLWNPGRKAEAEKAAEQSGAEAALYRDSVTAALTDLQRAYARRERRERIWKWAEAESDRMRENLDTARRRHEQGLVLPDRLEEARENSLAADLRALALRAAVMRDHVDLVRAGGGPWIPADPE